MIYKMEMGQLPMGDAGVRAGTVTRVTVTDHPGAVEFILADRAVTAAPFRGIEVVEEEGMEEEEPGVMEEEAGMMLMKRQILKTRNQRQDRICTVKIIQRSRIRHVVRGRILWEQPLGVSGPNKIWRVL